MTFDAARKYSDLVLAMEDQRRGLPGGRAEEDRWSPAGARFRQNPRRDPDENIQAIASLLQADDVLLDIGGGAGRYGLPLALRCREVLNVEPAQGMGVEFEASAKEAGIANARWVHSPWPSKEPVEGDVSLVANVTYFIRDIVPFLEAVIASSRRRVIISVASTPNPNQAADVFRLVHDQELAPVPGHRELLPVLWEMGVLPDVKVAGSGGGIVGTTQTFESKEQAVKALMTSQLQPADPERSSQALTSHFDDLFETTSEGFLRRTNNPRLLLITWETNR